MNNQQPAFPCIQQLDRNGDVITYAEEGMTLRDYFAAKALQAQIANSHLTERYEVSRSVIAKEAYLFADAMMEAREVKQEVA